MAVIIQDMSPKDDLKPETMVKPTMVNTNKGEGSKARPAQRVTSKRIEAGNLPIE